MSEDFRLNIRDTFLENMVGYKLKGKILTKIMVGYPKIMVGYAIVNTKATSDVRVNSTCLPQFSDRLVDLILVILQKFNSDPHVCSIVEDLVGAVSEKVTPEKRGDYAALFTRLTPFLVQILKTPESDIESGATNGNTQEREQKYFLKIKYK